MKYDTMEQFIERTGRSRSKINRFYKANPELDAETKFKGKWKMYPVEHLRYFKSEIMFDENKTLRLENDKLKSLLKCLQERNSLESTLWFLDWTFFVTVAYKNERNKKSCYRQMIGLYEFLLDKYGADSALNFFFTTEPFTNRSGYHNHFVLYTEDTRLHEVVANDIRNYFTYDRVDIQAYDLHQAGLWYMSKKGLEGEDYDIKGNNLGGKLRKAA
jgi:hypothetical protein